MGKERDDKSEKGDASELSGRPSSPGDRGKAPAKGRLRLVEEALDERLKELNYIYTLSRLEGEPGLELEDFFQEAVNALPGAMRHPEAAGARLVIGEREYASPRYARGPWRISVEVKAEGEAIGRLEVAYRHDLPPTEEDPFLAEERVLLETAADRFGRLVERNRFEKALRASQRWFRSLIENSYDAVTVLDADGSLRYLSPSIERMTGYSPEELKGMSAFDFIHPEDLPAVAALFAEKMSEPLGVATAEYRYRHADGSWRHIEAVGRNLLDDEMVRGIVVNYHDVTERREVEEALRESEERFRALAATAHDAIIMIDDLGEVTFWNAAAERMFGYAAQEVIGRDLHRILIPPEKLAAYRGNIAAFAVTGSGPMLGKKHELEGRRKDGGTFAMELSLSSFRVGGRWHAVGIARDISERKRAEERLRAANRELEAFAHTLSHDLRGMLSTAYGYARMLERVCGDSLDRERRNWLEELINALNRMDGFTTSLLEYARAGVPEGVVTDIPLREALDTAMRGLEALFMKKGVELTVDEGLPTVRADATRLQQVLYNLLHNAARHAGHGAPPRVSMSAFPRGGEVVVAVGDNGRGIPAEKADIIFEPFVRLRGNDPSPGLGIGLSTVRRAVEGWGGRAWVESEPGKGATFFFTVPLGSAPDM